MKKQKVLSYSLSTIFACQILNYASLSSEKPRWRKIVTINNYLWVWPRCLWKYCTLSLNTLRDEGVNFFSGRFHRIYWIKNRFLTFLRTWKDQKWTIRDNEQVLFGSPASTRSVNCSLKSNSTEYIRKINTTSSCFCEETILMKNIRRRTFNIFFSLSCT